MAPGDRPYLYAPPPGSTASFPHNGFDPKAVTRASYIEQLPRPPRPRQEGPLIDFNRHPDSYVVGVLPYGQTNVAPMHPATKRAVKVTRGVQLALRILQMIGTLGMLVCVICIQNTQDTDSYIIRVPVAIDILATTYAIYHLCRAAKSRTAASSASYHIFAMVIDAGLIPFYIFIAMLGNNQKNMTPGNALRWKSFFDVDGTNKIILTTWLDSIVLSAMHLVEGLLSFFLLIVFRKIANMPPDLNPLEDNLTSRRKSKHRYKSSELSTSTISAPMTESSVSLSKSGRSSPVKERATTEVRPISFLQTRNNSEHVYSPHNPNTAQYSRSNVAIQHLPSMYSQSRSERASRAELPRDEMNQDRTNTMHSEKTADTQGSSVYTIGSPEQTPHNTPPLPRKSSKRHSLQSDNWFVHGGGDDDDGDSVVSAIEEEDSDRSKRNSPSPQEPTATIFSTVKSSRPYQPVRQHSNYHDNPHGRPAVPVKDEGMLLAPLGMNPPTPPPGSRASRYMQQPYETHSPRNPERNDSPRPLSTTSSNVDAANRVQDSPSSRSKSRYYGDLNSAMAGIRDSPKAAPVSPGKENTNSAASSPSRPKSRSKSKTKHDSGFVIDVWRAVSGNHGIDKDPAYGGGVRTQDFAPGAPSSSSRSSVAEKDYRRRNGDGREDRGSARVVSSSGVDITDQRPGSSRFFDYGYDHNFANAARRADVQAAELRGRNVSGKVAEEGRGGAQWWTRWS